MKRRLFFIVDVLTVFGYMITSCSWDDVLAVAPHDEEQKIPMSFNVNVGLLPDPKVSTRGYTANIDGGTYTFGTGDVVALAIKGKSGSGRSPSTEVTKLYTVAEGTGIKAMTYSTDDGTNSTIRFDWMSRREVIDARAWSWGNSSTPATDPVGAVFSIESNQNIGDAANTKELLYSPSPAAGYAYSANPINIPLYHQLARVVVNVTTAIPDGVIVTGVQIGHADYKVPLKGTFAYSSGNYGTWTPGTSSGDKGVITAKEETAGSLYSAVLIPSAATEVDASTRSTYVGGNKFIVITTQSHGTYCYIIPEGGITLLPGKQYTFVITDKNQKDCSITVNAWTNDALNSEIVTFSN